MGGLALPGDGYRLPYKGSHRLGSGDNYKTPLIEKAIEIAARNFPLAANAIFHSDRGSNYTSRQFAETLKKHNLRQSVGRTGICYDCKYSVIPVG